MRLTRRLAGVLVLAGCLAGLTGAAARPGSVPARAAVRAPDGPVPPRIVLPFDAYRFTAAQRRTVVRAEDLLVTGCMRAHGIAGFTPATVPASPETPVNARRYGVVDTDVATRYGYHFPDPDAARRTAAYRAWDARLTDRERDLLDGTERARGCVAAAELRLRAGVHLAEPGSFTRLDFRSLDASAADPRVRAAVHRWRDCMAGRGLDYASPAEAIADPRWRLNSPAPSEREIATATADVRCKRRAHLVAAWLAAETDVQRALIARHSAAFATLDRGNARYLANARTVLAGHRAQPATHR